MIQIGNGNWAVKEDNLLGFRYDETEGVYFPREMTFTRASDGTRVNEDGLVENMPFNLLQQSNTFNTTWTTNVGVFTSGQSGYDGTNNAWKFESNGGGTTFVLNTKSASGINTASIYAKAGNINYIRFGFNPSSESYGFFDLTNGGSVVSTSGSPIDAKIERVGTSDWYRCSIANNVNATGVVLYLSPDGSSLNVSNNAFVYIQDAQLNLGSTAKPYFPTTNRQDVPRIDYSSGTGALLLEPQRTNLVTYSEQFDNAVWTKTDVTITANNAISPDGYQDADAVIENTASSTGRRVLPTTPFNGTGGAYYSLSVYVKKIPNQPTRHIYWMCQKSGDAIYAHFDMTNFSVNQVSTSGTGSNASASITSVGNDWYRITLSGIVSTTTSVYFNQFYFEDSVRTGFGQQSYTGNGASGFYLWGWQIEASSYPTSYIPTTSATVTRLADSCYKTGVADWIGQTEGTLFAEVNLVAGSTEFKVISLSDGGTNNRAIIVANAQSDLRSFCVYGGTVGTAISTSIPTGKIKMAIVYTASNYSFFVNGSKIGTQSKSTFGASLTRIGTDQGNGGNSFFGTSNQIQLYKTPLSDNEAIALTTI